MHLKLFKLLETGALIRDCLARFNFFLYIYTDKNRNLLDTTEIGELLTLIDDKTKGSSSSSRRKGKNKH